MDGPLYGRFLFSSRAFFSEEGFSCLFVLVGCNGWLVGWGIQVWAFVIM
jgi:hypothetical protein